MSKKINTQSLVIGNVYIVERRRNSGRPFTVFVTGPDEPFGLRYKMSNGDSFIVLSEQIIKAKRINGKRVTIHWRKILCNNGVCYLIASERWKHQPTITETTFRQINMIENQC